LPQLRRWFAAPPMAIPAASAMDICAGPRGAAAPPIFPAGVRHDRGETGAKLAPAALEQALTLPPPKAIQTR